MGGDRGEELNTVESSTFLGDDGFDSEIVGGVEWSRDWYDETRDSSV